MMSEQGQLDDIAEIFEYTSAEAASIGTKDGRTRLLAIRQGTDEHGQPCALYITGKPRPAPEPEPQPRSPEAQEKVDRAKEKRDTARKMRELGEQLG